MPSYREHYADKWLTSLHLKNQVVTITITKVTIEPMYNSQTRQQEGRLAASFAGKEIMLPLNKTNCKAMERITGTDDYDKWRNVRVTLTPGTASNGKGTIIVGPAAAPKQAPGPSGQQPYSKAQPAPAQQADMEFGMGQPAPVHGRAQSDPVHGLPEDDLVHGRDDDESDFDAEEEERPVEANPKSADPNPAVGAEDADALFFSPTDLQIKVKSLHVGSEEPMTPQQHAYITRLLLVFCDKPGELILSELLDRPVTADNVAGGAVGRYMYELLRAEGPLPAETSALRDFCQRVQVATA